MDSDILINHGSAIKSLDGGKIGGYLVLFGDETKTDLAGDFFTKSTNFGEVDGMKTPVWFNHRKPIKGKKGETHIVKEQIGEGTLKSDDNGIFIEAVLYEREKYEKALTAMGWSSGTAPHLVDREQKGTVFHIKQWLLGQDASITPRPCEPRTQVQSLKSFLDELEPPQSLKGLLGNKLAEYRPQTWEIWSAFCGLATDIAQVAAAGSLTGSTLDVGAKVKEATGELADMLTPLVTKQIEDFVSSGQSGDRFYLKSNPAVFHNLISNEPHAGSLEDRLGMTLGVIQRAIKDAKEVNDLRSSTKMGAKISKARIAQLKEMHSSLSQLLAEVETQKEEKSLDELKAAVVGEWELFSLTL